MLIYHEFITPLLLDEVGNHFRLFHESGSVFEDQFPVLFLISLCDQHRRNQFFVYTLQLIRLSVSFCSLHHPHCRRRPHHHLASVNTKQRRLRWKVSYGCTGVICTIPILFECRFIYVCEGQHCQMLLHNFLEVCNSIHIVRSYNIRY